MISTGFPVKPGTRVFIGGFVDKELTDAQVPVPPGTIKGLRMGAPSPPGAGSVLYRIWKNGSPTACTFTLSGNERKGKSLVEIQTADEDEIAVEVDVSEEAEAEVVHNGTILFVPTT